MRDNVKGGALTEVTFYILLSLYTPKHGYAVMQFIEETTGGRLSLGAGTLYGALNALQEKGWIAPCKKTGGRLAVTGKAAQSNGRKGLAAYICRKAGVERYNVRQGTVNCGRGKRWKRLRIAYDL